MNSLPTNLLKKLAIFASIVCMSTFITASAAASTELTEINTSASITELNETGSTLPAAELEQTYATHVVRYGETLGSIAWRYGLPIHAIAQANGIVNVNLIFVGQVLVIPGHGAAPTPPRPQAELPISMSYPMAKR